MVPTLPVDHDCVPSHSIASSFIRCHFGSEKSHGPYSVVLDPGTWSGDVPSRHERRPGLVMRSPSRFAPCTVSSTWSSITGSSALAGTFTAALASNPTTAAAASARSPGLPVDSPQPNSVESSFAP
jgi:hypothetical protein